MAWLGTLQKQLKKECGRRCQAHLRAAHISSFLRRTLSGGSPHLEDPSLIRSIKLHTELTTEHLTPELRLHLITRRCPLWSAPASQAPFSEPYWAFYWPGGQAIARYILDHSHVARGRSVLDLGCGSGACGLAATKVGARRVILNDIDPVACLAARLNLELNRDGKKGEEPVVEISSENLLGKEDFSWDLILIGDMFYDESFAAVLYPWLEDACAAGCSILIGDPGRHALSARMRARLTQLGEYPLSESSCLENRGFSTAFVWRLAL